MRIASDDEHTARLGFAFGTDDRIVLLIFVH